MARYPASKPFGPSRKSLSPFLGGDTYEGMVHVTNVSLNTKSPMLCALAASLFPGPPRPTASCSVSALENNKEGAMENRTDEPIIGLYGPPIVLITLPEAQENEDEPAEAQKPPQRPWRAAAQRRLNLLQESATAAKSPKQAGHKSPAEPVQEDLFG